MLTRRPRSELERAIRQILGGEGPVLVGPWRSEVGFEVLYWIPFVRRLVEQHGLDPSRLIACSRGGVADWYRPMCERYVDVLDLLELDDYRRRVADEWRELGGQKQSAVTSLDRDLLERAGRACGWEPGDATLHPSLMYSLLRRFWKGGEPLSLVRDCTAWRRFPTPPRGALDSRLPDTPYAALKFYYRDSLPDEPANRALIERVVATVGEKMPVVWLGSGLEVDDHVEADRPGRGRVIALAEGSLPPAQNLALQTVALAHAACFAGTYGGFTYLAASLGVPGLSFASHPEHFMPSHLDVARRAAAELDTPFAFVPTSLLAAGVAA